MKLSLLISYSKIKILNVLSHALVGGFSTNALEKTTRSIIQSYHQFDKEIEEIYKIHPAIVENYKFPYHYPHQFIREKAIDSIYVFRLKSAVLSAFTGAIWTKNKIIFQESVGSLRKMYLWNDIKPHLNLKVHQFPNPENYKVFYLPHKSFFHFILEEIPALLNAMKVYEDLKILVPKIYLKGYYKEVLYLLLGNDAEDRIIPIDLLNYEINNLVFTSKPNYSGYVNTVDLDLLNRNFTITNNDESPSYIYISRKYAKLRQIGNELELEQYLHKYGFKTVYLENLTFQKQLNLVANAQVIVAPHGAGLSHLVWGNKKKTVIEIFPSNIFNDCYARLCMKKSYDYHYTYCINVNQQEYFPIDTIKNLIEKQLVNDKTNFTQNSLSE